MKMQRQLWAFSAVYFAASLVHFAHNAEYIAFYPNMPGWLTREKVYLVWLAITGMGVAGLALWRFGWNFTIWFEAISGVALALCCAFVIKNRQAVQEP